MPVARLIPTGPVAPHTAYSQGRDSARAVSKAATEGFVRRASAGYFNLVQKLDLWYKVPACEEVAPW
jgi:hypothetical protein